MKQSFLALALRTVAASAATFVFAGMLLAPSLEGQELPSPVASPAIITAGVPIFVTFTAALTDPNIRLPKLQLWDPAKGRWRPVGAPRDNGRFGDASKGDRTFSLQTQLLASGGVTQLGLPRKRRLKIKGVVPTPIQLRLIGRKKGQRGLLTSPTMRVDVLTVSVSWAVAAAGGIRVDPVVASPEPGVTFVDVPISTGGELPLNTFGMIVQANPQQLSLQDWFAQYVDEGGLIAAAGSFAGRSFADGREVLVFAAPLPDGYDGPPPAYAYVMSPARGSIAAVSLSQDNDLYRLGYPTSNAQQTLLDTILERMTIEE